MGDKTAIEWTTATWNPWRGCSKVSPGCAHCYMFRDQRRYGHDPEVVVRASDATFYAPLRSKKWAELSARGLDGTEPQPLVFTCSWSDWFHEAADPWRDDAWDVIRQRPDLIWQILTKRPERIAGHLPPDWGAGWPNVWLGVSIENRRFVHRADVLRAMPAAVRFISAEPLLGPLVQDGQTRGPDGEWPLTRCWADGWRGNDGLDLAGIDWLIVGGESGPKARPMRAEWVQDLRDATRCTSCAGVGWLCAATGRPWDEHHGVCRGVPGGCPSANGCPVCHVAGECGGRGYRTAFFFKQWGGARPGGEALLDGRAWREFPVAEVAA